MSVNSTETVDIQCPYCSETVEIIIDCSVENQSYIEDCQVCCRPINLVVGFDKLGEPVVKASQEDEV